MRQRLFLMAMAPLVLLAFAGCAKLPGFSSTDTVSAEPMTQARMETVFGDEVEAIVGTPGAIQTRVDGISVFLISDPGNDRMRLVAVIASATALDRREFGILLRANFDRTLDARYAVSDGVVYSVYQHQISSLSPELIRSAVAQVVSLAKTFGTAFSAGELGLDISPKD